MSKLPVDIIKFNDEFNSELDNCIRISNSIQNEFLLSRVPSEVNKKFQFLNFETINTEDFLSRALEIKKNLKGYYPYMCIFTNSPLEGGGWKNLFADTDIQNGIALITTDNVPNKIIPRGKLTAYFIYYIAREVVKFILVERFNHRQPSRKGCLFDFMENKKDILKSMRANAICDDCRKEILNGKYSFSEHQFHAIDTLLAKAGSLIKDNIEETSVDVKKKIFIGSSVEGLNVARKIKAALRYDAHVDTWADGVFDRPNQAYIEVLERILNTYDFGIFVFTPDDKLFSRGRTTNVPRDNVIFEYGMFLGKHTRNRAFFVVPRGGDVKIMTDLLGLTSLDYDPTNANLQSAVSDACDQIRSIINELT